VRIWIDRELCQGKLSQCLSCLIQVARTGDSNHACIRACDQHHSKEITIFIHAGEKEWEPLVIPKELLDMVAYEFKDGVLAPKIEIDF